MMKTKVVAPHGQKMITVTLHFFTNDIAEKGAIRQRHARDEGWATLDGNKSHGLKQEKSTFHSLMEITSAVEKVLVKGSIQLHHTGRAKKYILAK